MLVPSHHVVVDSLIGHCGSIDAKPPPIDCVRCVHISFLQASKSSYRDMIWSDHGTGGNEDSSWWRAPDTNSIIFSDTYNPPSGVYYMLKTEGDVLPNVQPGSGDDNNGNTAHVNKAMIDPLPVGAQLRVGGGDSDDKPSSSKSSIDGKRTAGSGSGDESSPVVTPNDPRDFKKRKDRTAPRRTRRSSMADENAPDGVDDNNMETPAAPATAGEPPGNSSSSSEAEKQRLKDERKRLRGQHKHSRLHRAGSDDTTNVHDVTIETSSRAEGEPSSSSSTATTTTLNTPGGSTTDGDMVVIGNATTAAAAAPLSKVSKEPLLSLEDDDEPGTTKATTSMNRSESKDEKRTAHTTGESKEQKLPMESKLPVTATSSSSASDANDRKRNHLDMPALAMARRTAATRLVTTTPAFSYTGIWEDEVKGKGWISCWRPSLPEGSYPFLPHFLPSKINY
jgi:hypothetical protein